MATERPIGPHGIRESARRLHSRVLRLYVEHQTEIFSLSVIAIGLTTGIIFGEKREARRKSPPQPDSPDTT